MSSTIPPTPPSPGIGLRRKAHPQLPLSAFSPPNTGTLENFNLPSPRAVHPDSIIDANVVATDGDIALSKWKKEAGQGLGGRISGVVLSLPGANLEQVVEQLASRRESTPIVSLAIPFQLENALQTSQTYLSASPVPISRSTVYTQPSPASVASLRWALEQGRPVDIDIQAPLSEPQDLDAFEDLLTKAMADLPNVPPIILSNILPPPHNLELPIAKLMGDKSYLAFQAQRVALSLFPGVYVKFLPPSWNAPTPSTGGTSDESASKQKKEWKRRIKMYLGPIVEAFGYQRILFGTSPSPTSQGSSSAGDWYEIAKESLAELAVDQESVDAVFYGNAKAVYGSGV